MAGQPLQRWSTGGPPTVPGSGSLVDELLHGRPAGEPPTPGRCQLLDPPPVQGEVIWWTSHSIGGPLVGQPLQGFTGGLHPKGGPLVAPALQEMPACGPAKLRDIARWSTTPGEASWALHQSNGEVLW